MLAAFAKQRGITFPLLADEGSATIRRFGLLNPAVAWGLGAERDDPAVQADVRKYVTGSGQPSASMAGMAFPGTFMLDRRGRVTSRFFEEYYVDRNTVASVMVRVGAAGQPVAATKVSSAQLDLTTYASDTTVSPGNRVSLVFDVTPRPGMHVYAPGAAGYKVIAVSLDPQPFLVAEPMRYPPSEIYFFKPLNERVPVYRKPFRLIQDLLVAGTPAAQQALRDRQTLTVTGTVQYQACDDAVCFNPVSAPVSWTLALRPLVRERPLPPSR